MFAFSSSGSLKDACGVAAAALAIDEIDID